MKKYIKVQEINVNLGYKKSKMLGKMKVSKGAYLNLKTVI